MNKASFLKLLKKYINGKAAPEEQQFIISYYNLFENDPDVLALLGIEKKDQLKDEMYGAIMQNIAAAEIEDNQVKPLYRRIPFAAAAAILLFVGIAGLFFARVKFSNRPNDTTYVNRTTENQLIRLQDGSSVKLSPDSKITYPLSFVNLADREVKLEGEAFFDIKPDPSKPFIVSTRKIKTQVLGTSFNIKALKRERNITITVTRGKVKVSESNNNTLGLLTKSEQISYDTRTFKSVKHTVDTLGFVDWKIPEYLLNDVSLQEAVKVLEKRYQVNFIIKDSRLGSKRFTTTFQKNESLDQVLKSLCEFNSAVYQFDKAKRTIFISRKPPVLKSLN